MSINLTMMPTEAPAVIYFADGTTMSVDPQSEKYLQLPSGSFCTISSTAKSEEAPTGYAFAEAMFKFWQEMMRKMKEEMQDPQAQPL